MALSTDNTLTEDIIKRRLLIDGDGMGDERKLNTLIKSYLNFADGEDSEENDIAAVKRMIAQAKTLDYVARRTLLSTKINEEAKDVYVDLQDQVQSEIYETKTQIVESKALLEEATKHRKYSMEYDALAKLIESKPDRKMTEVKRMGLQLELDTLRKRKQKLDDQLSDRKRTVSQLGHTMEMVKDHLKMYDEKQAKKSSKGSRNRNGETAMDVDSTSQSEPPSPMEQTQQEPATSSSSTTTVTATVAPVMNGTAEPLKEASSSTPPTVSQSTSFDKKSEKYEDLSESEGDDHS